MRSTRLRTRSEDGAAAVEFALVTPILLLIVFAIINYGLVFNDSNNARQGAREAARRAAVQDFGSCAGTNTDKLKCMTKSSVGALSGTAYTSVKVPAGGWVKGAQLTVCVVIKPSKITGFVPLPKQISSTTSMSIEVDSPAPGVTTSADVLPAGLTWPTGCT
jgi:Flp pilus assembly protein TadG